MIEITPELIERLEKGSAKELVVDNTTKIERDTNEAFDERFYKHPTKINPQTGNNYFPAFHFITSMGAPESPGLSNWKKDKGHHSEYLLERSAEIGSYVHDCIDMMIKTNIDIEHESIHKAFPNPKEAQKIKESLLGFLNFMSDQEPEMVASEHMECGDDFGFTCDLAARIKEDGYKNLWILDWKTSKVANDDHKMQIEAMRRTLEAQRGGVVVLGNSTKKKYTFTPIKPSEHDYFWNRFVAIKETAYVELLRRGTIKPRVNNMPPSFSLKDINLKRLF